MQNLKCEPFTFQRIEDIERQEELTSNKNTKRAQQRAGVDKSKLKKPKGKVVKKASDTRDVTTKEQAITKVKDHWDFDENATVSNSSKEPVNVNEENSQECKELHHEPEILSLSERLKKSELVIFYYY